MSQTAFANRLQKMYKHYKKWANKQNISCFRIFDNDISEFPLSIDVYENFLYISEYDRKHQLNEQEHNNWLQSCIITASEITQTPVSNVFIKKRQRQKGTQQYEKTDNSGNFFTIFENGLKFIINLSDYLDTGLFLDHRNTRQMVRNEVKGKRFLNLFAYTGSFSVYAAAGGAIETTSVDLSKTYLQWANNNMRINGFTNEKTNHFIHADVKQYLQQASKYLFDVVVIDPPTFSNSKRMNDVLDIQNDHVELLNNVLKLTIKGGLVYFSTNYRRFVLAENKIQASNIKNISSQTIPNDFRNNRIHQCYKIIK